MTRYVFAVCLCLMTSVLLPALALAADKEAAAEEISGWSVLAIQAALPAFTKQRLKLEHYTVLVGEHDESVFVSFLDLKGPASRQDVAPKLQTFEVELDRDTFAVKWSGFVR